MIAASPCVEKSQGDRPSLYGSRRRVWLGTSRACTYSATTAMLAAVCGNIERFAPPVSSRRSFVGTVFCCVIAAVSTHLKICSSSSSNLVRLSRSLSPMNRLVDIDRHPFFVFGKRCVRLLQITECTRFVRRTRKVREQCPEFGCFRSVLLCREHLRPFLWHAGFQLSLA